MTADILPFPAGFPPAFRRFSALRVLLRDNVHPQLEACLLSNPDHTCIQSQTLKLYQRLGDYFDWRFSTGSLLFLTGSLAGFSTLLRPFFCCAAAATHRFSLLFLTIFLLVPGSSARFFRRFSATFRGFCRNFPRFFRRFSLVLRFPSCRRFFLCSGGNKSTILPPSSPSCVAIEAPRTFSSSSQLEEWGRGLARTNPKGILLRVNRSNHTRQIECLST